MAASKYFEAGWTYNPEGNTHNDRVGRILVGGVNLSATMKANASEGAKTALDFEKDMTAKTKKEKGFKLSEPSASGSTNGDAPGSSQGQRGPDGRGYSWVDGDTGANLGSVAEVRQEAAPAEVARGATLNFKQQAVASMAPTDRTMAMWRKVNPGCMESTTRVPQTTMKEHFVDRSGDVPNPKKVHNFKKTDFSEYVEASVKSMRQVGGH